MAIDENHIYNILRNRLFDYSRRNKLLYFKPSLKHLDLTLVSFSVDGKNKSESPEIILKKNKEIASKIISGKDFSLQSYFPFTYGSFVFSALNRIRLQANKDINEYGFNQLKLAIGLLEWFDLKNNIAEKITSPLILLPVQLVKKKGIQDDFIIRFDELNAEINPVLAGKLKDLYNIVLPVSIDLSAVSIIHLYQSLKKQIELTSDVQLSLVNTLDIDKIDIETEQFHKKYNKSKTAFSTDGIFSTENTKRWRFDITRFILGNFNYRKMSLVGDYDVLMEHPFPHDVFRQLFRDSAQNKFNQPETLLLQDQFQVIQADSTQKKAIEIARTNESYIIQGPPGTGKSQTIANLIADFVARGKKVLFVCEKRAAIDVVYFRLKQKKLDEFCTLIHDSQADKKEFVMDLKKTSESYAKNTFETERVAYKRNQIIYYIERELYAIRLFHSFMNQKLDKAQMSVRQLLDIVISTQKFIVGLTVDDKQLPGYDQWMKYGNSIQQIGLATKQSGYIFFAENPLSSLHESTYFLYDQSTDLKDDFSKAIDLLNEISGILIGSEIPEIQKNRLDDLRFFVLGLSNAIPFHEMGRLDLLVDGSELKIQFEKAIQHIKEIEKDLAEAVSKNNFWIEKLTSADTENALEIIKKYENTFFSFLSRSYRRTKKSISKSYDFSKHEIKPTYWQVIKKLQEEYQLHHTYKQQKTTYEQFFKLGELKELETRIRGIYKSNHPSISYLKETQHDKKSIEKLKILDGLFRTLDKKINNKISLSGDEKISGTMKLLEEIIHRLKDLPLFLPHLKELSSAEKTLKSLIKKEGYTPDQIEALLAKSSLNRFFQLNPEVMDIDGNTLQNHINKIEKLYDKFLQINSIYIRSKQRDRYNALIRQSELSTAGKNEFEKEEKKSLSEGNKILRKEFQKSMRYKSIRELASLESGRIVRELKPVWLMSPLSVSDTLPLQVGYFDVVIFDEASQITLEEGVPSIYRAEQTIIVGDTMQMPPSNFFNPISAEEPDGLSADSFLEQGAHKFPSVRLGWHYRSRHESLIAFSNAAFYENQLLMVPDLSHAKNKLIPITVEKNEDAISNLRQAQERPISYHYIKNGIYNERTNIKEAEYIAEVVRELLHDENNSSIGVVAFSKEQQREIEDAVNRLCYKDRDFGQRLEDEFKRMEDGQFTGLFFKNLENIQGDERDVIIMSTCYGYGSNGKMVMNFGPINRGGGEKRLNVIFSRAKKNMFVVSSIKHTDITNHHNTGSNYFRKYLQYAEAVSIGDFIEAHHVIKNITSNVVCEGIIQQNIVLDELKSSIENNGYVVVANVGQSNFKCHLGIKKSVEDEFYTAGILLDDESHYANDDLLEQYIFKSQLLKNNGWNIIQVFSKDWYVDSENVLKQVVYAIENKETTDVVNMASHIEMQSMQPIGNLIVRLEKRDEKGTKFWEIQRNASDLIIKSGNISTSGKSMVKPFYDDQAAEKEMQKMIALKLKNGYFRAN